VKVLVATDTGGVWLVRSDGTGFRFRIGTTPLRGADEPDKNYQNVGTEAEVHGLVRNTPKVEGTESGWRNVHDRGVGTRSIAHPK
jgi:hypothetical protein